MIAARGIVPAGADEVFAYLADLDNHWLLADRFELISLHDVGGGRVRMHGPLGISRTAETRVTEVRPPRALAGTARVGRRTRARVTWRLEPAGRGATCVELSAEVLEAGLLDRLLLAVGGRRWLAARFPRILASLASRYSRSDANAESNAPPAGAKSSLRR